MTATDTFYSCTNTSTASQCDQYGYTAGSGESSSFYNWNVYGLDDDENDKMCTPHTTNEATYACERLRGTIERLLNTDDDAYDF